MNYFAESEFTPEELQACLADGSLMPWRVGQHGEQWYRTTPEIHGVPNDAEPVEADDEDETEIEMVHADD